MLNVGASPQIFLQTLFQVEEQTKGEETQSETMETEEPSITTETSQSSEAYTTVVASGSDYNHRDSLYMSEASENVSATEQTVAFPQSTYSANISVTTVKLELFNSTFKRHFLLFNEEFFLLGAIDLENKLFL